MIFSHSSARAVNDVPRNVPDDILQLLPTNGGIVMVTFVPGFLSPKVAAWNTLQTAEETRLKLQFPSDAAAVKPGSTAWTKANPSPRATIADAADHIDHIRKVAGIDHIGLGGDFDGITAVAAGHGGRLDLPGADRGAAAPRLQGRRREEDLGLNILRVMREVEKVAKRCRRSVARPRSCSRSDTGRDSRGRAADGRACALDRTCDSRHLRQATDDDGAHPDRRTRRLDDGRHARLAESARSAAGGRWKRAESVSRTG